MIIEKFNEEFDKIIEKVKEGEEISNDVRDYSMNILKEIIRNWKEDDEDIKEKLGEEAGEIPIKLFGMADLKVEKRLDEIINQLMDIEDSKAMKEIDRKSLIEKVYFELNEYKCKKK